jgi:predicted RNA-binding protein
MCLAKAYIGKDSQKELLVEQVASLKVQGRRLLLTTLFGEQREIEGIIKEIDFRNSSILLEKAGG